MFSPRFEPRIFQFAAYSLHRLYYCGSFLCIVCTRSVVFLNQITPKKFRNSLYYDVKCIQILNFPLRHGSVPSAAGVPYKFLAGMTLGPGNVRQSWRYVSAKTNLRKSKINQYWMPHFRLSASLDQLRYIKYKMFPFLGNISLRFYGTRRDLSFLRPIY